MARRTVQVGPMMPFGEAIVISKKAAAEMGEGWVHEAVRQRHGNYIPCVVWTDAKVARGVADDDAADRQMALLDV